jgi:hypothetical protein
MTTLLQYWPLAMLIINGPIAWAIWGMKKEFASKKDLDGVRQNFVAVEKRLGSVEQSILYVPSREDLHQVQLQLADVVGELKAARADYRGLEGLLERTEAAVARHENIFADAARGKK